MDDATAPLSPPARASSPADLSLLRMPPEARPRERGGLGLGTLLLVLVVGGGLGVGGIQAGKAGLLPWTRVHVEVRAARTVARTAAEVEHEQGPRPLFTATGFIAARRRAAVGAPISGKVVAIYAEEGTAVVQSQVVARLDDRVLAAEVARARANLKEAQRELERREQLVKQGSAQPMERDEYESKVEVARAELQLAIENLDQTVVRSPFDGVVLAKLAEVGESVFGVGAAGTSNAAGSGGGGILTIADTTTLEVEADVQETRVVEVFPGQECVCELDAMPGLKIAGFVRVVMPTADRRKGTVTVKVTLRSPPPVVRPDLGAKATFLARREPAPAPSAEAAKPADAIAVPRGSVHDSPLGPYVWVLRDSRVARRSVTLGEPQGDDVEVAKGLDAGEPVIVSDPAVLTEGLRVRTD